ncbi:MAG: 4Fe-4S dicluster domain-containing protein [Chloroflexi bacterium]|nr:4Fe-4S dicluster domain-containing protein [Chloroflexota bacterium]
MGESSSLVDFSFMGKHYRVPEGLTIMAALEHCGYRLVRGCGCRAGFCGACATVYNFSNDRRLRFDLACQKTVEQDMCLVQIPFFPAVKALYDLETLEASAEQLLELYPELITCLGCNTCTKACPQELEVMEFVSRALKGDITGVADRSFDCIMCGLCAARCPQGIAPHFVALLCRRLYGRHLAPRSRHLEERIAQVEAGKFDDELAELKRLGPDELRCRYEERDIEAAY